MERLTERDKCKLENGEEFVLCNHKEEDCNDSCMKVKECRWYKKAMSRLKEYEDLEEQGFLLRLPCKVGGRVYYRDEEFEEVFPIEISTINISDMGNGDKVFQFDGAFYNSDGDVEFDYEFDLDDFGKTVFLTPEEAEKALKNRKCQEMQWLTWKNVKEWGEIQCQMLGDKYVMTYYS